MDKRIRITRHELGFTVADDRTGLRIEFFEEPTGLAFEAYGYHSSTPQPELTILEEARNPGGSYRMPVVMPVQTTRAR